MAYYITCPNCGSNLDPGEKCDCECEKEKNREFFGSHLKMEQDTGQMSFLFDNGEESYEKKMYV